jgi:endoglucanase
VRELIERTWQPLVDETRTDPMGNLMTTVHGTGKEPRPRILVTAHMDEIGLMVTAIQDGFIRFTNVGGIDVRVLLSQPVLVHGQELLTGLVGSRPPHVTAQADRKKYPALSDLVIDTGLPPRQVEKLVRVGDPVTFDQKAVVLGEGWVSGKSRITALRWHA